MRGRSNVGVVLVSMHFVEYDVAHFVGCHSSGSCTAEIVAFIECGGRGCGGRIRRCRSCCGMSGR